MSIEEFLPWLTILIALLGFSKWVAVAASNLTKAITNLNVLFESLANSFKEFKTEAKSDHARTHDRLDDHEIRIHSLEDWKKTKEGGKNEH